MSQHHENERRLRELFAAARRADRAETPDYRGVRRRGVGRSGRAGASRRGFRIAALGTAAGLAVAALAGWLWVQDPGPLPRIVTGEAPRELLARPEAAQKAEAETPPAEVAPAHEAPPAEPAPARPAAEPVLATKTAAPPAAERPAREGALVVEVRGETGPLPGATVTLAHDSGWMRTASRITDRDGRAGFRRLRAGGGYVVEVSFPGLGTGRRDGVQVVGGETSLLELTLAPILNEKVAVVAQQEVLDVRKTTTARRPSEAAETPAPGRFYQNVLTMAYAPPEADPNVHGSRSRAFRSVVGGVANVDPADAEHAPGFDTESYGPIVENRFLTALENPLSTFSIDVDTASYANVRRFLRAGRLPPPNAVRIEEMVNYFRYDYPPPSGPASFSASVEVAGCPWNPAHRLARIGLRGREVARGEIAGSNLVFLIDVSGSMRPANKLPLLKTALSLLVEQLDGRDRVAIVVYAGASGLVLPPTPGSARAEILAALDRLDAGGSTNGGAGLELAYRVAREHFVPGGINRVILATDGDFNVGLTDRGSLLSLIEKDAREGIFLTALGFGMGNYKDDTLELLADRGNGNYAYIDTLREARKVLVEQVGGTLVTIAKDVKIQVEFNPTAVGAYRLIGYENRMLRKEDFNDDRKDAGEIGSGHTVTALYEIVPPGVEAGVPPVDPLRYRTPAPPSERARSGELMTLKLRYKEPDGETSRLLEFPVVDRGLSLRQASPDFLFAAAVAEFGLILRDSPHKAAADLAQVRELALAGAAGDVSGYRTEFLELVDRAAALRE